MAQASGETLFCNIQWFINSGWQVLYPLGQCPKQKAGGDNKRGCFFLFPFVSGGKHFPEISHGLPLPSLPELSPLSKPGPMGNGITTTALRLHVIMVTIATETKLRVNRLGRIETDSYPLLVFDYSVRNWLSDW